MAMPFMHISNGVFPYGNGGTVKHSWFSVFDFSFVAIVCFLAILFSNGGGGVGKAALASGASLAFVYF